MNNILSPHQFGCRKKRGTQDAILQLQEYAVTSIDDGRTPVAIMLGYSAAFDCVPHEGLLKKLEGMGITANANKLMRRNNA